MITVNILINGHPIFTRTAVRTSTGSSVNEYTCDDGKVLRHRFDDGAVKLAIKMLKTIKEPKHKDQS